MRELAAAERTPARGAGLAPVHVLYGGAHLFKKGSPAKLGAIARAAMETYGADDEAFAEVVGAPGAIAGELAARVRETLANGAVQKSVIDFEDGYGPRPDDEEDADAERTGRELALEHAAGGASILGIRIKALDAATGARAVRTLDLFVTALLEATSGALPRGFSVALPKVTRPQQVAALAELLAELERSLGVHDARIAIELMVETPRALLDEDGRAALPALVAAGDGRVTAVHLGAYDLTAALGITASEQRLDHPACDAARTLIQLSLAGTGIDVFDGATTILPIAPHRGTEGAPLSEGQRLENVNAVRSAWQLHARAVRRALTTGIYAGWDLHPAQIPARLGAVHAFFLGERRAMSERLASFVEKATRATRTGRIFDDAATGQGLVEFFLRGVASGALTEADVAATTLTPGELRGRSFAAIVARRSGA
ncbi:MAG: hypothetical protein JWP97_6161 [Labilithrix sp.]|nr:hypothetical protein [Labilithrix sp.]